jgi:hypothetical protein
MRRLHWTYIICLLAAACGGGEPTSRVEPQSAPETPAAEPQSAPEAPATVPQSPPEAPATVPQTPGATPARDVFGVEQLYPTRSGAETWAGTGDLRTDERFDPQNEIVPNGDGSWKMRSTKVRMSVTTSAGYDASAIRTYDRDVLAAQGYMQSPRDWRNVEMTGYFRVNASNDWSDNIDLYARGGRHNDSQPCEGSAYKGQIFYDGRTRWAKETWHVSYDFWSYAGTTSPLRGRWVGFKAVQRNVQMGGAPAVLLQLWLDDDADGVGFEKVYETVDAGDRFGDATYCWGSADRMPITWGGPLAVYRWDSATDVDFKWLSVREID